MAETCYIQAMKLRALIAAVMLLTGWFVLSNAPQPQQQNDEQVWRLSQIKEAAARRGLCVRAKSSVVFSKEHDPIVTPGLVTIAPCPAQAGPNRRFQDI